MVHSPIETYGLLVNTSESNTEEQIPVCYTEVFASPLEFVSGSSKKLKDTGVSDKYKTTYQSSYIENKKFCQKSCNS